MSDQPVDRESKTREGDRTAPEVGGPDPGAVVVRPAASVVLLRDGAEGPEILYLRRSLKLAFHPGSWVFPGGRVDRGDWPDDLAGEGSSKGPAAEELAARRASAREALEEAALELDPATFEHACHWTTPPGPPRRFATWFFVGKASEAEVRVDGGEIIDHRWERPRAVIEKRQSGEMTLAIPTFVLTWRLLECRSVEEALRTVRSWPKDVLVPRLCDVPGGRIALYEPDAGYRDRDPSAAGARHRMVMVDDDWSYERDF